MPIMTTDHDDNVNGDGVRAELLRLSGVSLLICGKSSLRIKGVKLKNIAAAIITYAAMSLWFSKSNERKKERNPKFISRCMCIGLKLTYN